MLTHTHTVHWKVCVFISKKQCHVDPFDPFYMDWASIEFSIALITTYLGTLLETNSKSPEHQWLEDWKMIHVLLGQQKQF